MKISQSVHSPSEIINAIKEAGILDTVKDNKKVEYINAPFAFDIETTSFTVQSTGTNDVEKRAIMYIWTLSINGIIVQGRTWSEFVEVIERLSTWYELRDDKRLVIYVHNLAFEFQFMHRWFEWKEVFSLKERQPIRALTTLGVEFRCSLKLSGYSLENLGSKLTSHDIEKLVGDLDYSTIRNSKTTLTNKELQYCINDVLVVTAYIEEYIDRVGGIQYIPNTKTGEVRNYARKMCFYGGDKNNKTTYKEYRHLMSELTLTAEQYEVIKRAFSGGFTHANALYVGETLHDIYSMDFTSSYPYVMVSEKFPMSAPKYTAIKSINDFRFMIAKYCCVFDIEFYDLESTSLNENYISYSHCDAIKKPIVNNGRIVKAEYLSTTITDRDYIIINSFYKWSKIRISNFWYMRKDYLPTNFVKAILSLYIDKTTLKGVEGKEVDYLLSKERINSLYGMTVTDICRDKIIYSPVDWTSEKPDFEEAINKNNVSKKRFLYYPWGVWVTAYARFNLFTAIKELQDDYVYSDTDSVKFYNYERHKSYFDKYNNNVMLKLKAAMKAHKLPFEMTCPKTIDGREKQLGVWDFEGKYSRFKTLGAKRYLTEKDGKVSMTVSGLSKKKAVEYLIKEYGSNIFDAFCDGLYIKPQYTGKLTHTYLDNQMEGYLTDYQGNTVKYLEYSGIHLSPADYNLSINKIYLDYILNIKDEEF